MRCDSALEWLTEQTNLSLIKEILSLIIFRAHIIMNRVEGMDLDYFIFFKQKMEVIK